ncbi:ATP-dependent RecD-like DNA helicase [Paenisporosarcina cavernae]|uniref:ATP-dependent RecD2 DNA helicase n=1 Tax=Paenisporosarcina cavernae TaxID=2320858 RepID=A0A385YTR2_9BACL|nr:ATP-dependent RecD-like DNA helicase [Paenisporosarcina cavernae]AYC29710.1 ATP-dependent RecD-like DNA helicase [Paenisporosarcina cavernae]
MFVVGKPVVTIFHNANNLYSIIKLKVQDTDLDYNEKELIVTGYFPSLMQDELYRFNGEIKNHPKYGMQFQVTQFSKEVPETEQGIVTYLSSDLFPGIGKKTAEQIVKTLGPNALRLIMDDPEALNRVKIKKEKKESVKHLIEQNLGLEKVLIQLNEWGFGAQLGMKIYQTYREETVSALTENPYRLIEDVEGVGFHRADELAYKLGISGDHPSRIKAAILHTINTASLQEGHVYVPAENLLPQVQELLHSSHSNDVTIESITSAALELVEESKLCGESTNFYLPSLYFSEVGIVSKMEALIATNSDRDKFPVADIRKSLGKVEENLGVQYANTQVDAIEKAMNSSVLLLTGGPGTGKTTVVRGLVEVFANLHGETLDPTEYRKKDLPFPIVLAAPTGRAAKRLQESTGLPASTIHRLLGFTGQEKEEETEKLLEAKLIIIDEMSMVDTWLAHQLLKSIPESAQLVFVGDQDQLPPVGPGQVLKDLLASNKIETVELTDIYRQSSGSSIIELAHQMKRNELPPSLVEKTSDRSFLPASTEQIPQVVEQVVKSALSKGHTMKDIQVLAPMYRGPAGIDALNKMIQEMVNPNTTGRKEVQFGDTIYRIGDKVLQLVNQPESNVFNGDMGEVISIFRANETIEKQELIVVDFDGNEVTYTRSDLNQLTLAYCCSIHKSQGSEFPIVIMPVVRSYHKMLRKNLLYTAITRAKDFLILCGEESVFRMGVSRTSDLERLTSLKERLSGEGMTSANKSEEPVVEIEGLQQTNYLLIHPMIGMDNISPTDFM